MNHSEKLKLARKYFIQQKLSEIGLIILGLALLVFVPYLLGHIGGEKGNGLICKEGMQVNSQIECNNITLWVQGFMYLLIVILVVLVSFLIYLLFATWLSSNWEKAKRRAGL